jgi:hypothetical protein
MHPTKSQASKRCTRRQPDGERTEVTAGRFLALVPAAEHPKDCDRRLIRNRLPTRSRSHIETGASNRRGPRSHPRRTIAPRPQAPYDLHASDCLLSTTCGRAAAGRLVNRDHIVSPASSSAATRSSTSAGSSARIRAKRRRRSISRRKRRRRRARRLRSRSVLAIVIGFRLPPTRLVFELGSPTQSLTV